MTRTGLLPDRKKFEQTVDGKKVGLYVLQLKDGVQAAITNYGARWVSMIVPDKKGELRDVVVGFETLDEYMHSTERYYGATVGRFANRIAKGKFTLNGKKYQLATNNGPNHLHGGPKGFPSVVWDVVSASDTQLELSYHAKDGEEGYPGNLTVHLAFTLSEDALQLSFRATTDQTTIVNLTNHAYFNLNGKGTILDHQLTIHASKYTPIDATSIPLGRLDEVAGTPFDFRKPAAIGARINQDHPQLKNGSGYDHNFVLDKNAKFSHAATATGDESGISMEVWTDEPGLQFYSGNFMKGKNRMRGGFIDDYRAAFCLETQHFPDSPNHPSFPSVVLQEGEAWETSSKFKFF